MKPLWKVPSGKFAGWRASNGALYNASGQNVGYFNKDIAYSLAGKYIGEIYNSEWIGKRKSTIHSIGSARVGYVSVALAPFVSRVGLAIAGWEDPDF